MITTQDVPATGYMLQSTMKPLHVRSRSPDVSVMAPHVNNRHPLCVFVPFAALLLLVLLVWTRDLPASMTSPPSSSSGTTGLIDKIHVTGSDDAKILQGVLNVKTSGQDGVPYYHCAATAHYQLSIVLLHGSSFTKEDWKRVGILQQLCSVSSSLQVTALDLSVRATADDLGAVLDALRDNHLVSLPVTALVTPSASGGAVAQWISQEYEQQASRDLLQYVQTWIPVASPAVKNINDEALHRLKERYWPILAINGDRDTSGGRLMERLGQEAGATVKELHGGHPVYLESPTEFVFSILDYLNVEF